MINTNKGRRLLADAESGLFPLEVDRDRTFSGEPEDHGGYFAVDNNGLEWAVTRNTDRHTTELVVWAVNNLSALLDSVDMLDGIIGGHA